LNYSINGVPVASATATTETTVTLVPGTALAACVQNSLRISGVTDLSGNAIVTTNLAFTAQILLVARGNVWKYQNKGGDLLTAWREVGYDDSAWPSGGGPIGFEPDNNLPLGWELVTTFTNFSTNDITTYFRTHFTLNTDPESFTRLQITEVLDDGAVFYFNGKEAYRNRMTDPIAYGTLAGGSTEPHPLEGPTDMATTGLQYGDNVLAVEVHQSGLQSSDIVFGCQIVATVSTCAPGLRITLSGPNAILTWPDATYHLDQAPTPAGAWARITGAVSGHSVPATTGVKFFRLSKP
jgi:hypothetical protein